MIDLMLRRRIMMLQKGGGGRLPSEYQEVEYIESSGSQYIDLPFGFNNTDDIETCFSIQSTIPDKYMVSPSVWNDSNNRFAMGVNYLSGVFNALYYTFGYGNTRTDVTTLIPFTLNDNDLHVWRYSNFICSMPDLSISIDVSNIGFGSETANLRLFYGYNTCSIGKLKYYTHKKENYTCYLIPCYRKSDHVAGMYDIINHVFYTNAGTGVFIIGPDIN